MKKLVIQFIFAIITVGLFANYENVGYVKVKRQLDKISRRSTSVKCSFIVIQNMTTPIKNFLLYYKRNTSSRNQKLTCTIFHNFHRKSQILDRGLKIEGTLGMKTQ